MIYIYYILNLINFVKIRTLNAYKKMCVNVFLIFFNYRCNNISGALYKVFTLFNPTTILLTFIGKKTKKLKIENIRKQLKIL